MTQARSALEVANEALARIERLNPRYSALATVTADAALDAARQADVASADGRWLGLLHGLTVVVKDNIDTAGVRTACGSRLFADRVPNVDAPVVARLRQAGAVVLGKAAMMELAFGVRSLDAVAGQCRNPWNPAHVPGGSSGGSAAAVALDLCAGALGTDTGGSVRVPAAFCGIAGLRPTFGRVPNRGCLPVSATFDTIGPMARHVGDLARLLTAIAGFDPEDPLSANGPNTANLLRLMPDVRGLRIGLPRNFYFVDIDRDIDGAVRELAQALARAGAEIVDVTVDHAEEAHQSAMVLIYADACALHANALDERRSDFSPAVYDRIIQGRARSAVEYAQAQRFREMWRHSLRRLFDRVDMLLTPATPYTAGPIEDGATLHEATRHATRFAYGGGLAGIPGLVLPCGFSAKGMPIGAQLESAWWREDLVLRAGLVWQQMADWHLRRPPVG